MAITALTQGVHHIGLTVPDLGKTRSFFLDTLEFKQVGEVADYPAVFLSDGTTMITLWQAANPSSATPFDRKNVIGLHHYALKVGDASVLKALHRKLLEAPDVAIEFAPETLGAGSAMHMMISIPGGIRMELIAPQA